MNAFFKSIDTGIEVFVFGEKDAKTLKRKIGFFLKDEDGDYSDIQYIAFAPISTGKTPKEFYDYGFTRDEISELTEKLKAELANFQYKKSDRRLCFNEVYRRLTAYAEQENDLKTEDGFLGIEVHKFRKWFETEAKDWKYLRFLKILECLERLKHNKGRSDYRLKSNGDRYYCFKPWTENKREAGGKRWTE